MLEVDQSQVQVRTHRCQSITTHEGSARGVYPFIPAAPPGRVASATLCQSTEFGSHCKTYPFLPDKQASQVFWGIRDRFTWYICN